MNRKKETDFFLSLVRAGLWEKDICCSDVADINFPQIYQFAYEQSVLGLLAAGIEHADNKKHSPK